MTTEWLAQHLDDPALRVVDVRWYLDAARKGGDAYAAGHVPGAVFLDVDADLSAPGGGRGRAVGRHPWPSEEQVRRVMGRAGIGRIVEHPAATEGGTTRRPLDTRRARGSCCAAPGGPSRPRHAPRAR